jgi:hypothetical protein
MKIRLHVNRNEMKKGKKGWPWTLHTSQGCTKAKSVTLSTPCYTEYRPELPSNPKVFLVTYGNMRHLGNGNFIVES